MNPEMQELANIAQREALEAEEARKAEEALKAAGTGGRRHRGSKKAHKGKRHGNASLRAWVTFVKKVQKEEGIGYKEAMSVAKRRKDKGEKWRGGGEFEAEYDGAEPIEGGRKRRRHRTQRRSRSHRRTRSHKRSRRHH